MKHDRSSVGSKLEPVGPASDLVATTPAESEARLRAMVDHAVDGIITIDEQGSITDLNPAVQRLFDYRKEELIGQNIRQLMPEPYHSRHDDYLRNYINTGHRKVIGIGREVEGRRKDGSVFPLDLSVSELVVDGRRYFTGIVRDVTVRNRIEAERLRFVSLVENSTDFIAMATVSWEIFYINRAGQQLIGVEGPQVNGLELRDLWTEATLPEVLGKAVPIQLKGGSYRFQGQIRHMISGEAIDIDCNASGIRDTATGETWTLAFSIRDIREQMRREQAVRDSEARLKAIVDSAVDGIITIDERGRVEAMNPAAVKIFGYAVEEVVGQNIKILMPQPYHDEHDQYLRNYRHTGQRKIIGIGREVMGRRKDGSIFPIDLSVSEVVLGDRRLFTGLIRNITERKQEEQYRNLLISELSHRVKNTLATVVGVSNLTFGSGQLEIAGFETALASFEGRLHALAHAHSRLAESNWRGASLESIILDEIAPYRHSGDNIHLAGPEVVLSHKTAVSISMAIHELATNAAKHGALTSSSGSVSIEWQWLRRGGDQLSIRWIESGGPEVIRPQRSGFGRVLLERGLAHELGGKVHLDFAKEGFKCTIVFSPNNGAIGSPSDTR